MTSAGRLVRSSSPRWGTPPPIATLARELLDGAIDLDPCSEAAFEHVVGAARSYSLLDRQEDGLALPWIGRVLCNPPGGLVRSFWHKTLREHGSSRASIVWIGFSVEQLCVMANEMPHPLDFPTCFLRSRISFTRHDGKEGSPSHANYVTGVGIDRDRFARVCRGLGKIV